MFDPIDYALHYGGRCRDCADADGVCPTSGMPCDPSEARRAAEHCLKAWGYGIENGFIANPFAGLTAHRVISDEMRHAACKALNDRDRGNAVTIADVNAMLVAALAVTPAPVPHVVGWQPMRTMPKNEDVLVVQVVKDGGSDGGYANWAVATYEDWYEPEIVDQDGQPLDFRPTHWMPLPPLPDLATEGPAE